MAHSIPDTTTLMQEVEKPKFSYFLTSQIITINVAQSRVFYLHSDLLLAESKRFANSLKGDFNEAKTCTVNVEDEDPELFGYFVEYMYRNQSILSRETTHYSEYITLARLYAMGERLVAPAFQGYCLWRFTQSLVEATQISEEVVCDLLHLACTEITERVHEDPLRSQIFWLGGSKVAALQKSGVFRQMLCELPDMGRHICLWVHKSQPLKAPKPMELDCEKFGPESEHILTKVAGMKLNTDNESL